MTELQKEVIKKINRMNEQDIKFLLIIIDKLMPNTEASEYNAKNKLIAFQKLNSSIDTIQKFFPVDFDPEKEYRKALEAKYGNID